MPEAPMTPEQIATKMSDADKLRLLAAWFDMWDERDDVRRRAILDDQNFPGKNDVQRDLLRIADSLAHIDTLTAAVEPCPWCGHPPMCHKGPEGECVGENR